MSTIHERLQARGLQVRACRMAPDSINEEERSVEAIIATESPVRVMDYQDWEPVDEVLLMSGLVEIPKQIPLLDSHDRFSVSKQLGSTRGLAVHGDELRARNYFADDAESLSAWGKVRGGHVTDNSVGYAVDAYEKLQPGETRTIGEREFTAEGPLPLKVVTRWRVQENSLTPIGADPRAKTRSKEANVADKKNDDAPKTEPRTELEIETRARAATANAEIVRSFCPLGSPHSAEAERMLVAGKDEMEIRKVVLERMFEGSKPVGTPEAEPEAEPEDKPETRDIDEDMILRAFTG